MSTLADYIKKEMVLREMSMRAFAEICGVTHTTLMRYLEGAEPTLDFLVKLSRATGADLISLIDLAFPGVIEASRPSARAILFAQQLDQLPDDIREAIFRMIFK